MLRRSVALLAVALWLWSAGCVRPAGPAAAPLPEKVEITILHINDPHGTIQPYEEAGRSVGGYARLATAVDDIRRSSTAARVFLIHAGDEFSRGDELTRDTLGEANIEILNHIRFDAWVPGNGDCYDGVENLVARIRQARFPVLAANVRVKSTGEPLARPFVIEKAGPVRVALVGLCWLQPRDISYEGFIVTSHLEAARQVIPQVRDKADVVVAVTHIGVASDKRLAETVPGIDVIIGAHTHTVLPQGVRARGPDGREVLICQTGIALQYLGKVDLVLRRQGKRYVLDSAKASLIPLDDRIELDPAVTALIDRLSARLRQSEPVTEPAPATAPAR